MMRFCRHIFNALALLSLLMDVAVSVLWVRSYWISDQIDWRGDRGWRAVSTTQGYVAVNLLLADWSGYPETFHGPRYVRDVARLPYNHLLEMDGNWDDKDTNWEWAGLEWHGKRNVRRGTLHAHAVAPFWSVVAMWGMLPLTWVGMRVRSGMRGRRRRRLGLCVACGYDVRATPGRCPECGTVR